MDYASVVTYAGDVGLFEDLENSLVQAIPKDATEWRRPYGRAVKSVYLDASFVPFSKESVPKQGSYKLIAQPILHTYWSECSDIDLYRSTVKGEIEQWLKQVGNADWMIILVEVYDIRKSNKLLPRTTVLDKVRTDFAVKNGDRIVGLIHPIKSESKSAESWRGLVNRMRVLILSAYTKTLSAFEEAIRANRECRPQPTWSYCSYFAMQEELALVYEMLGLNDEALVQYDELDALFTQFVLNSTKGETPKWLASFAVPLQQWAGPTLCQRVTPSQRDLLRCSKLDLLQFRSYLFGRQCSLLFLLAKPQEVAQRTVAFLHNCVLEMKILEVSAPEGALATWVFLVCLEILQTCEKFVDSELVQVYSVHTAGLWAYARDKLKQLGTLCGLAPGPGPTSEQLHIVVQLSSGMGDPVSTSMGLTPVERLKLALSSKEAYNNYFLELSELAISTYKHIGRMRFAKLIGIDLADLYLALGQPEKAASFLSLALQSALDDKWTNLAAHIQLRLVRCFPETCPDIKHTMSCAAIASSDLDTSITIDYYNKFLESIKRFAQDTPIVTSLGEIGYIKHLDIDTHHQICRGQCVINANLELVSRLPGPLRCDIIRLSIEKGSAETSQQLETDCQEVFKRLPMYEHVCFKEDGSFNGANIICREPQKALKRTDSQGRKISAPFRKDYTLSLVARNIVLLPGVNSISLGWTAENVGRYLLGQLNITVNAVEFLEPIPIPLPQFFVEQKKSSVTIRAKEKELVAGLPQTVELLIDTGSYFIIQNTPITVTCSTGLKVYTETGDLATNTDFILSEMEPFEQLCILIKVFAELPAQSDEEPAATHKISIYCGWCDVESSTELSFLTPLRSIIRLHTVANRKLLQVTMSGLTAKKLLLRSPKLKAGNGVELEDKNNTQGLSSIIETGLKRSFLWELDMKTVQVELESVPLTFIVNYCSVDQEPCSTDVNYYKYKCHFGICNFKTLFVVKTALEAGKDVDFCRAGAICQLNISVSRVVAQPEGELAVMYEISADQQWGICGRTAGVMTFEKEGEQSVILDVIPNTQGYLQVPNVRLYRYIPAVDKETGRSEDSAPRLEPFTVGQVYCANRCEQVHVLQAGVSEPRN